MPANIRSVCVQGYAGMSRGVVSGSGPLQLSQGRLPGAGAGAGPRRYDKPGRGPLSQHVRKTLLRDISAPTGFPLLRDGSLLNLPLV